jgi:hypothetical protein
MTQTRHDESSLGYRDIVNWAEVSRVTERAVVYRYDVPDSKPVTPKIPIDRKYTVFR